MSRLAGIPHASVCGGRGRCSTCRVRIEGPSANCRRPGRRAEGADADRRARNVRLACQFRPPPGHYVTRCCHPRPTRSRPARQRRRRPRAPSPCCSPICAASRRSRRAALRCGVPAQPLFPRMVRPRGGRRAARQVHRRWRDGDLRPEDRAAPASRRWRGPAHASRWKCSTRPYRRTRPAAADRDRYARRPGHRRRDGPRARHGEPHGHRRYRQHGEPPGEPDEGTGLRAGRLAGAAEHRRGQPAGSNGSATTSKCVAGRPAWPCAPWRWGAGLPPITWDGR